MEKERSEEETAIIEENQEQRKLNQQLLYQELSKKASKTLAERAIAYLLHKSKYGSQKLELKLKGEFKELKKEKLEVIIAEINALLINRKAGKLNYDSKKEKYVYEP